jgi:hypothetical protein
MQVIDLRDQGIESMESSNQILQLEVFSCSLSFRDDTGFCSDGTHVGTGGCLLIPPIGRILVCTAAAAAVGVLGGLGRALLCTYSVVVHILEPRPRSELNNQ